MPEHHRLLSASPEEAVRSGLPRPGRRIRTLPGRYDASRTRGIFHVPLRIDGDLSFGQ